MKIGWCIPESQHSLIYFQSNLHSEFAALLKFVYWIVMVSLLFPHFQGPAWLILTCLHHFPCAPSCGPLFLHCQCLSQVGQPSLHALAHSAHCSCQIPTISFRHSLSTLFSKPYQWLHWRVHWWPGWAVSLLAAFPFTPTCPHPQLIPCIINGWQCPGTQAIFLVCVWRSSNGTFLDKGFDATLVPQQKIHFHSKIVVVYEYLQFISTDLSQIV